MFEVFSGNLGGSFISAGTSQFLPFPTDIDWLRVQNQTVSYAAGAGTGAEFFWCRGMAQGLGTIYVKTAATNALQVGQVAANAGFFYQNNTINNPGASVVVTAISGAQPPVVTTPSTAGLVANSSVVRIFNTAGALQLGGIDFTVGTIVNNTSFTLAYAQAIVAAAGPGTYRIIPFNPYFYPNTRTITNIYSPPAAPNTTIVTLSVTHYYQVGQQIKFVIPTVTAAYFGMTQLNDMYATIINVGQADANGVTNTITVNINSSAFTAFAWPLTINPGFTPPQVVVVGENTAYANNPTLSVPQPFAPVNPYLDSTRNGGVVGMLLQAGTLSPAGIATNLITWQAGKCWNQ